MNQTDKMKKIIVEYKKKKLKGKRNINRRNVGVK